MNAVGQLFTLLTAALLLFSMSGRAAHPAFPLKPDAVGRHLVDQRGQPFFYNADTAWMLFLKLTELEAEEYLAARQAQGFNTLQIILTGFAGMTNRAGQLPFAGTTNTQDFARPNEAFFAHVDRVLARATERGFFLAIAPAWSGCCGEGWAGKNRDGSLKPLEANGPEKSRDLGRWLGRRYAPFQNILWILGGDNDPGGARDSIRALALGLKEGAPHHLLTFHAASSHSSTDVWPGEGWIDVPMVYTYFRGFNKAWNKNQPDVYEVGWKEHAKTPARPFFLGESTYEGEHGAWGSAQQARKQAYWAVLSGGIGNAYGSPNWNFPAHWREVLKLPGAASLKHFRAAFESRPWWKLAPDMKNELVTGGHGPMATNNLAVAALANDGSFGVVYSPSPRPLRVALGKFTGPIRAIWSDPTSGASQPAAEGVLTNRGERQFESPTRNAGGDTDWLLILEPAGRKPPAPLYRDPVHDGAADATLMWNRAEQCWWMLYTNRRADADHEKGVKWVHGTDIGIASMPDRGANWLYRGIARGLEFETNGTRNTFWAPEVVEFGGKYHAFISYVRGVPETWKGTRDIVHYTSTNLLNWKFESIVVPGSIDACVHRLPDGRWRMWFKNEQKKIQGTVLDSDDLYTWKATASEMPDPDPGKGEGPEVFRWNGWFWMVKDLWRGLGVYRSPDLDSWKFMGVILDKAGKRPGDQRIGQHPGVLVQDNEHAYLIYFVHQAEKEPAYRHTWLQVARLGFDGNTLTCDRDAEFELALQRPAPEFTPEHIPVLAK